MQKRKRAQVLEKQASLSEVYPKLLTEDAHVASVRQIATDIVSAAVRRVQAQPASMEASLKSELPSIVKNALHELALEQLSKANANEDSSNLDTNSKALANEPNLDLTAKLNERPTRQAVTLKVANQAYLVSSDADVDYMQAIAKEANLLLKEVKKQLPHSDKQSQFVLALLNALDEKADISFKYNEQSELLEQAIAFRHELEKRKAVLERKIQSYKQKLADLAAIFTDISERFSLYKADPSFSSENFQKLVLQILDGDESEKQLSNFTQLSLQDCLQLERNKQNER